VRTAQNDLSRITLRPSGYYAASPFFVVRARCVGSATPKQPGRRVSFVDDRGRRLWKHLRCELTDPQRRTWTLVYHPTGSSGPDWVVTDLRCVASAGRTRCP
jgi:hypothetical protein